MERNTHQTRTSNDSLFGSILTQAFTAMVLGPVAGQALQMAEASSMFYRDRFEKPSLGGTFARNARAEKQEAFMIPLTPAPAPAGYNRKFSL